MNRNRIFLAWKPLAFVLGISTMFLWAEGTLVLAGGGSEGELGETDSWSYLLYQKLFSQGDINNDGALYIGILATSFSEDPESAEWLPKYLQWIGKTLNLKIVAHNWAISSREQANDQAFLKPLNQADILFIKGGDQGEYYDLWNDTVLEQILQNVFQKGVIGGTSAGAMSLAEYSFSGGNDLVSADVLSNACTEYLDDVSVPQTSGIHKDFLSFLPKVVIDTHYTQRGRMGRLMGILAKTTTDFKNHDILGIGIEQKTGLWVHQGIAEVIGYGEVAWIQETTKTICLREAGYPLVYTDLRLDRLTHGKKYEITQRRPILPEPLNQNPSSASNIFPTVVSAKGILEKIHFEFNATTDPEDFKLLHTKKKPYLPQSIGFEGFENSEKRMDYQESLFYGLQKVPSGLGILLCSGNKLFLHHSEYIGIGTSDTKSQSCAGILIDTQTVSFQEEGFYLSNYAISQGCLRATTVINATVHVVGDSRHHGIFLQIHNRKIIQTHE